MSKTLRRLFVYGTLRKDLGYRTALVDSAEVVGKGRIKGVMHNTGGFPAVRQHPTEEVTGQVLSFDGLPNDDFKEALDALDHYEGHPRLFKRTQVDVTMEDGTIVAAHAYLFAQPDRLLSLRMVASGDWASVRGVQS